jgi:hypothetical protein
MVKRVDYHADKQGYCGWETFSGLNSQFGDLNVMDECVRISISQMERQLGEQVRAVITEL